MKLTATQLRSIIAEEIQKSLEEPTDPSHYITPETLQEVENALTKLRIELLAGLREEPHSTDALPDPSYEDALDTEATTLTKSLVLDILDRKFGPTY